jgi:sulfite dehydrogenase
MMNENRVTRRAFLRTAGVFAAVTALGEIPAELIAAVDERMLVRYPEKRNMILLTARPPQLESPLSYFRELITPNDALFVRWHLADIPTSVDVGQWKLTVSGNTEKEVQLSLNELKTKFEKVTFTAVMQCAGNGRSFSEPRVIGGQWKNGAMGNTTWTGVRLRDLLNAAGIKPGSSDVTFKGLDKGSLPSVPNFVKSLSLDKAREEDILVAYEMNNQPLLMLNGFPVRLIVPAWYATYWVKSLTEITVVAKQFNEFWMNPAYRMPDTPCGCVPPGAKPQKTIPVNRMTTRSLIVEPEAGAKLKAGQQVTISGIAFSGGYSIKDVIVSLDNGKTWNKAALGKDLGKYSWIQWSYTWKPAKRGNYTLMAKATNSIGESQPFDGLWNPSGYLWNKVEPLEVTVS